MSCAVLVPRHSLTLVISHSSTVAGAGDCVDVDHFSTDCP